VDVREHIRKPTVPTQGSKKSCVDCKQAIEEEEVAVQRCCMVFHRSCWETTQKGYFGRSGQLKCVCRMRRTLDEEGNIKSYGP
jgi:hypothetical protein